MEHLIYTFKWIEPQTWVASVLGAASNIVLVAVQLGFFAYAIGLGLSLV